MHITIFYIIVGILVFDYLLDRFLSYLNSTRWSDKLPEDLEGIYDAEKYRKQQNYEKENHRFSLVTGAVSFVIIMLMLFLDGFQFVHEYVSGVTDHPILMAMLFFGILMFASDIINTPFAVYDTFIIEEKYGFNTTTVKTFIFDKIKGWFLAIILGGGLLSAIIWIYTLTSDMFWIYAWILITAFMIFMTMFYSTLIVPLFNKQTPLEEGDLRSEIEGFSKKVGFKLKNIYQIDGSKRSRKANAYFSGIGAKKRIVLYDTLIKDLNIREIVAVLAHEIGHYKKKHTLTGIVISVIQTGITLYLFSLFIGNTDFSKALVPEAEQPLFHIGLITFGILYSPISTILGLGMNIMSRKNEYQADRFAGENYDAKELQEALKRLSVKNLSNLTPHPVYVFFNYSHPPLLKRLEALKSVGNRQSA